VHTIGDLTDHVEQIINFLDLRDFVLCGNSLGGLIAIDYCLRHPAVPMGLALAGSAGLYERSLTNGVKPRATREFVRSVISDIFYDDSMITEELVEDWYQSASDRNYARFLLRLSRATRDRCVEHELGQLDLPTMVIWGRNDEITPPHVGETFKQQIRGAKLRYIEDCGHAPNLEQPQIFADIMSEFLPECFPAVVR
jgi:pimeloyl-ACP methyl ester carboxylesterase